MAISLVNPPADVPPNLLHLWQEIMLESTWHYNQVTGTDAPLNDACHVYVQPTRDMLARALYEAYSRIREKLQFDLQPQYHVDRIRVGNGIPLVLQSQRTQWKQVKAVGIRATSVIEADAAVVYSKSNPALAVDDTATITVTTTVTDVSEIQVFFRKADGAPNTADARWQITPLNVELSGGSAIISGHRSLFVQPLITKTPYIDTNLKTINEALTTDAADFVTLVDVYRVYPDATNACTLISDPVLSWCCNTNLAADVTQAGVAWLEDAWNGIYRVRLNPDVCWHNGVEYIELHYLAGADWQYQAMDSELANALVHLANTLMPQKPTDICDQTLVSFAEDINVAYTRVAGGGGYTTQEECPFGIQIGAQKAWQITKSRLMMYGGKITR